MSAFVVIILILICLFFYNARYTILSSDIAYVDASSVMAGGRVRLKPFSYLDTSLKVKNILTVVNEKGKRYFAVHNEHTGITTWQTASDEINCN